MGTSARLWELVGKRLEQRDRAEAIDRQIWDEFGVERGVMFTDLSGFSRQVARFGIVHFLQIILEQERLLVPVARAHGGTLIKAEADSLLLVFPDAIAATRAAVDMQHTCAKANVGRPPEEHIILCVGIGHGRVLRIGDDEDVYGHEVNLASKLGEDTATGREILLTPDARKVAGDIPGLTFTEVEVAYADETRCWRVGY
jgi:class 3 adenylate cyclase